MNMNNNINAIKAPRKYLLKYKSSTSGIKMYRFSPVDVDEDKNLITGYVYADADTRGGLRSFKRDNILKVEVIAR